MAVDFRAFTPSDIKTCLGLFDANCPEFFAPNERADYQGFLADNQPGYELYLHNSEVVGAYGLMGSDSRWRSINWILVSPEAKGLGVGSALMQRALTLATEADLEYVKIAASHLSAPFFSKYGAQRECETEDGWGPGMHRIDMILRLQ